MRASREIPGARRACAGAAGVTEAELKARGGRVRSPRVSAPGEARTSPGVLTRGARCPAQPRRRRGRSVPTGRGGVEAATVPAEAREGPMLAGRRGRGEGEAA